MNKIMSYIAKLVLFMLLGCGLAGIFIFAFDMLYFQDIARSNYETPWYNDNNLISPYTNLRIYLNGSTNHWTKNVVGDDWLVKESTFGKVTFWTVLEKKEKVK